MTQRRCSLATAAIACITILSPGQSPVAAQGKGTTTVAVTIDGNAIGVTMTVNPEPVLRRLAGARLTHASIEPQDDARTIATRAGDILRHIVLQADDRAVALRFVEARTLAREPDADAMLTSPRVRIRLTGILPDNARTLRWSYGLAYAPYELMIDDGVGPSRVLTVDGAQMSASVEVKRRSPGSRPNVVWGGLIAGAALSLILMRGREHRRRQQTREARPSASPREQGSATSSLPSHSRC